MTTPITNIKGIGEVTATILAEHGYKSVEDIAKAKEDDLAQVKGFGAARAKQVIITAQSLSAEMTESKKAPKKEKKAKKKASSKKQTKVKKKEKGSKEKKSKKKKKKSKTKKGKKKK